VRTLGALDIRSKNEKFRNDGRLVACWYLYFSQVLFNRHGDSDQQVMSLHLVLKKGFQVRRTKTAQQATSTYD